MTGVVIVQNDRGKTFEIAKGSTVSIHLAEKPSTGYRWELGEIDKQIIILQDSEFLNAPETGFGGSGTRTFTFKPQSHGTTTILLKHKRGWEPEDSVIDHFEVTIRVLEK